MKVRINTHGCPVPTKQTVGDWYDMAAAETVSLKAGEVRVISLGISVDIPYGHTGYVLPRSSTPIKHGIIMANSMGVIDCSYKGDGDIWGFVAYSLRDTTIEAGTRIAQMCIAESPAHIEWEEVDSLGNENRGGYGSTGD